MKITKGTSNDDDLRAHRTDDTIRALGGDDTVIAANDAFHGRNIDVVYLNAGDDYATGFLHSDTVYGGLGDDTIVSGFLPFFNNSHAFYGGPGDDWLESTGGGQLYGGRGDDTLTAFLDYNNVIDGGPGNDTYFITGISYTFDFTDLQGRSNVYVETDAYNCTITTGDRSDNIAVFGQYSYRFVIRSGERGDVVRSDGIIYAEGGHDDAEGRVVYGGRGHDTLTGTLVHGNLGHDDIIVRDDTDSVIKRKPVPMTAYGGWGDDTMTAVSDDLSAISTAYGAQGDDLIKFFAVAYGGDGDDEVIDSGTVYGEAGNDRLSGHIVRGQSGNDTLQGSSLEPGDAFRDGEDANDKLYGAIGSDELRFALYGGDDEMTGGAGADTFVLTDFNPETSADLISTADYIMDFAFGVDRIDVSVREGVDAFSDLTLEPVGTDTAIKDSEGFVLVIVKDASPDAFSADDFIFT